jgi:hypothetical protein
MGPRQGAIVIVLNRQQKFEYIALRHLGIYEPTHSFERVVQIISDNKNGIGPSAANWAI